MSKINYDDFEDEMDFIEDGSHLKEAGQPPPVAVATADPSLMQQQQAIIKRIAGFQQKIEDLTERLNDLKKTAAARAATND